MNEKPLDVESFEIYFDHSTEDKKLICELTKHSSVLYGLFVDVIRQYYKTGSEFIKGCPDRRFDYDKNKTGIWIDKEMRWEDEHPEFRPAIIVKLSPLKFEYPTGRLPYGIEGKTGTTYFMRQVSGVVSFAHIAKTSGEANVLCDNTLDYLWNFSYPIKKDYCLSKFRPVAQTPIEKMQGASKEQWVSTCSFEFEFIDMTGTRPEAPVLQDIIFKPLQDKIPRDILRTDLDKPRQGKGQGV